MNLFHYSCDHGYEAITQEQNWLLVPGPDMIGFGARLVWLTDLPEPDVRGLGLTSITLSCDRTKWRFSVWDGFYFAEKWTTWAHRRRLSLAQRNLLEAAEGARPVHWWVTEQPVPVVRVDPT